MIDYAAKLKEIDDYVDKMPPEEFARQQAKTKDNPEALFDLVRRGDVMAVAVACRNDVSLSARNNAGDSVLHVAARANASISALILAKNAPELLAKTNHKGELPSDCVGFRLNADTAAMLEAMTHQDQFRELYSRFASRSFVNDLFPNAVDAGAEYRRDSSHSRERKNNGLER